MDIKTKTFQQFVVGAFPAACLATALLSGCGTSPTSDATPANPSASAESHDDHDHAHPEEGPHHGHLVELGNEEYHAEVVHHDETGTVTVYLLDGSAKNNVPIDAAEVTINLSHEGKAEQFKLPASPDTGDPTGKSSRFVSQEKHLAQDLDAAGSAAKLVVTINDKQYTGKIEHDHGHEHAGHKH